MKELWEQLLTYCACILVFTVALLARFVWAHDHAATASPSRSHKLAVAFFAPTRAWKLTRIGWYLYRPGYTLSFSWKCVRAWRVKADRYAGGGWWVRWGCFLLEKLAWPEDDPYGRDARDSMLAMVESATNTGGPIQ